MLNPSLALLASIAAILILLRLKLHPSLAIFLGSFVVSLLVLPLPSVPALMWQSLLARQTIELLVVIASALTLSSLMEEKGLLARLATTMEGIGPRLAIRLVPAVIGLVPMPAGALVSATANGSLAKRLGLNPEQSTFVNYWFRHIWEFSVPVYPAIITTSVILSIPLFSVMKTLIPMTILVVVMGAVLSYKILRKTAKVERESIPAKRIAYDLLRAAWPILLLISLILLGVKAMLAFPLTLALLAGQQRVRWPELRKALKYGLNPTILFLLYAIMLYKATIENSNAASVLLSDMQVRGLPALLMLVVLPLLMGLATGVSMAFVGVALSLLVPFITSGSAFSSHALLLAYVSGMVGILLSPLHLCLILSTEYFKANLGRVYRYVLPLCLGIEAIAILVYIVS